MNRLILMLLAAATLGVLSISSPADTLDCPVPIALTIEPATNYGGAYPPVARFTFENHTSNLTPSGCVYRLESDSPHVPDSTPAGGANHSVRTNVLPGSEPVTVTVRGGRWTKQGGYYIGPLVEAGVVLLPITPKQVIAAKSSMYSGETILLTVNTNSGLNHGKSASVELSHSPPGVLQMPSSVTVSGTGVSASGAVNITAAPVSALTTATINATRSGVTESTVVLIQPAPSAPSAPVGGTPRSIVQLRTLSDEQIRVLERSGIRTAGQVATQPAGNIARLLGMDQRAAEQLVLDANSVRGLLDSAYLRDRTSYPAGRGGSGDDFERLVQPDNVCTILVRKTCGSQNQCAGSAGCQAAMYLLSRYNQGGDAAEMEMAYDACLVSLADELVFHPCMTR